ncbi:MAG: hypothetical protein NC931_05605 [Candidatus Omnitrophica bacterium]|nr:hypothetical protein [Candidatus Omnitrophota bacterium]
MRKITGRERITLGIGVLIIIIIAFYFIFWPVFFGDRSKSGSSISAMQEKLQLLKKLKAMEPILSELESTMSKQAGYGELTFKEGIADAIIMKHIAQLAAQSEIREIEQLDAKLEKSKKSSAISKNTQIALKSIVDQIYLVSLKKNPNESETNLSEKSSADNEKTEEQSGKTKEESVDFKITFPPIPKNIPDSVKESLVRYLEANKGKNLTNEDMDNIISEAGIKDDKESEKIKKQLSLYNNRVKDKKIEITETLSKLDILRNTDFESILGRYSIKMVFKSQLPQLVKLLYNLQTTAKWIKVDGLQITIADRNQALLGVELSMTATVLHEKKDTYSSKKSNI